MLSTGLRPCFSVNDFALSLFPFVEGRRAADVGLSGRHWAELGSTVKQIHASQLPSDLLHVVPSESFTPTRRQVPRAAGPMHADLHACNMPLDFSEHRWLVDWDETILALKVRDLMFVMGGIGRDLVSAHETSYSLQGFGEAEVDQKALTDYRYAWAGGQRWLLRPPSQTAGRHGARQSVLGALMKEIP